MYILTWDDIALEAFCTMYDIPIEVTAPLHTVADLHKIPAGKAIFIVHPTKYIAPPHPFWLAVEATRKHIGFKAHSIYRQELYLPEGTYQKLKQEVENAN